MNNKEMIQHMLSTEVLTSFESSKTLESHVKSIASSKDVMNSTDLDDIYTLHFCNIISELANLDGHVCRIKDQNYLSRRITMELINDAIPFFVDTYKAFLSGDEYTCNLSDLAAEYSKEEVFCVRIVLDHLRRLLNEDKLDITSITEGMSNFKEVPLLTELFGDLTVSELKAMSRDDFEDYLEADKGCDDNNVIKLSSLRDIIANDDVAQAAIFIHQEPVTEVYSISIPDRIMAARIQLLLQDLSKLDELVGV